MTENERRDFCIECRKETKYHLQKKEIVKTIGTGSLKSFVKKKCKVVLTISNFTQVYLLKPGQPVESLKNSFI